jgi:hypothetical protein
MNEYQKVAKFMNGELTPRMRLLSDEETQLEAATIEFNNTDRIIHTFSEVFAGIPAVCVTPESSTINVSLSISSVTTSTVTIEASSPFTGNIHLQAIYINCP